MPWMKQYPYAYYEETPFTIHYHSVWHDVDHLAQRVATLEQKVAKLEEPKVASKEEPHEH